MKAIGICLGASTITSVKLRRNNGQVVIEDILINAHEGDPRGVLIRQLKKLDISSVETVVATGRKFSHYINFPTITEPEAIEYAYQIANEEKKPFNAIISLGGETFIAYTLDSNGKITRIYTGNKCASGTGEFFLQQIKRMNLNLEEVAKLGEISSIHPVSGRCSVFCKSDCTHALNRGVSIKEVVAGLCQMIAEKALELLVKVPKEWIMVTGGVSQNSYVIDFLKKKITNLVIPPHATYFEAFGAGVWALQHSPSSPSYSLSSLFKKKASSFHRLPPIKEASSLVSFKNLQRAKIKSGDRCIIGLDVGSTTTKAVLIREGDNALLASVYLRTYGNPVQAARNCYRSLFKQTEKEKFEIIGVGVTGSGRQIAALHAQTKGIVNEIIAHAVAASYFDREVETIFEIGGQDAKYTYLVNGVACDYAMNEACSAGTGSFLEESAQESLGIPMEKIAEIALKSQAPLNFNDQCAAFISSDIKTAIQEGISIEDIVAGLVYSICLNYNNRVKGNRIMGKKIFMQGGVCYNQAVPLAMANLLGKEIIVPPEPGLMGAYGVALEIKNKIHHGFLKEQKFSLSTLLKREIKEEKPFICQDKKCERKCQIAVFNIEGKKYPFGGVCNKYYNLRYNLNFPTEKLELVRFRERLLFGQKEQKSSPVSRKKIGLNRSFTTHLLYPLYYHFFTQLGLEVVLPEKIEEAGINYKGTSFCYPAEIAHGFFLNLLQKKLDYIFLPQITELSVPQTITQRKEHQCTCIIAQGEPFYLKVAFKNKINQCQVKVLTPLINFATPYKAQENVFIKIARELGFKSTQARSAYQRASQKQEEFLKKLKQKGKEVLSLLRKNPEQLAIVLFGRPYNAFCAEANMGIPHKFASRGFLVLPFEFLPFEEENREEYVQTYGEEITWAMGQMIIRAALMVKKHPQLFGVYITNFSCGPDSFLNGYFRDIMGKKPSLTLELDNHTQDVGLNTRVEAFLDIIRQYQRLKIKEEKKLFTPAEVVKQKKITYILTSQREKVSLFDPRVHLLLPPMGDLGVEALASVFNGWGIKTTPLKVSDGEVLSLGRGNTSCKECLPLILTTGSLLKYLKGRKNKDEILLYFMPTTSGNCRFPQYNIFLKKIIAKNRWENIALLSLTSEDSYGGLGDRFSRSALKAVIIADIMEDIRQALRVLAIDRKYAREVFRREWQNILLLLRHQEKINLKKELLKIAYRLKKIPLKGRLEEACFVSVLGEIYVRRDVFCTESLISQLAEKEIIVKTAPVVEWLNYVNYLIKKRVNDPQFNWLEWIKFYLKDFFQRKYERELKQIFAQSGLYHAHLSKIEELVSYGRKYVTLQLTGEPIIVIGAALKEILKDVCGIISIGPFACLPTRLIEAILSFEMKMETKLEIEKKKKDFYLQRFKEITHLPFLSLETDGSAYSQVIEAQIENFCLQVRRLHQKKMNQSFPREKLHERK